MASKVLSLCEHCKACHVGCSRDCACSASTLECLPRASQSSAWNRAVLQVSLLQVTELAQPVHPSQASAAHSLDHTASVPGTRPECATALLSTLLAGR